MPHPPRARRSCARSVLGVLPATAAVLLALGADPGAASAATGWGCDAGALRGTIASAPPIEPVTANRGATTCAGTEQGPPATLPASPLPLTVNALSARTSLTPAGATADQQQASSVGEVASLRVGTASIPAPGVPEPLAGVIQQILTRANPELLAVDAVSARATGQCTNGRPALAGSSSVAGLRIGGQAISTAGPVEQAITLVTGPEALDRVDPASLPLPPPLDALPPAAAKAELAQVLSQIPPQALQARVVPGEQVEQNGRLTRRALHVQLSLGGRQVLDLVLGEASVDGAQVQCGTAAQLSLGCTRKRLVLIDVLERSGRVALYGVADRRYIGRKVDLRFVTLSSRDRGRHVATATVGRDGFFRTTAKLPPRALRGSNRARYQAVIDTERSLRLKLRRRMVVEGMRHDRGKVTISGRVVRPLAQPRATIVVKRRVSCNSWRVVNRIRPGADGRFSVQVDGPPDASAATYRLETRVRKTARNPRTYPTFTLPRSVQLS